MKFLYPLGLLILLFVPILIIIYILRRKYKEHIVSSSYLWELSNRFLKRKPIKKINNILSLILQICFVVIISIAIAQPVFYVPSSADNILFIVDASGSMNIKNKNKTRFELAKQEMNSIVKKSKKGCTFTIIFAGKEAKTIIEKTDNKDTFYHVCNELEPEYAYNDLASAIDKATTLYQNNEVSKLYLLTDKTFAKSENIEIIDFSSNVDNYAVYDFCQKEEEQNVIKLEGKVLSYETDATLNLELFIDDIFVDKQTINVIASKENNFVFEIANNDFKNAKVVITNKDALLSDNQDVIYRLNEDNSSSILLVSDNPLFLKTIVNAIGKYSLDIIESSKYQNQNGYDLYIFDCFTPLILPNDGSTWFLNSSKNVDNSGFIVQDERIASGDTLVTYSNDNSDLYNAIIEDTKNNQIAIYQYHKYSWAHEFTSILNYDNIPLLFVGNNDLNLREVIFAFDLHNTNLPLLYDFIPLIRNLLNYSLPNPVEDNNYVVGDQLKINISSKCESVKIQTPLDKIVFISTNVNIFYYDLKEIGTYHIFFYFADEIREYLVYSSFDKKEGCVKNFEDNLLFYRQTESEKLVGKHDDIFFYIILCGIIFLADWMVYYREQY